MEVKIWDILDVLLVAYLIFIIYKLLRGTIAFNIFVGVVLLYVLYWIVDTLNMRLLSLVLGKFVGYGVLILIIIFQPEVRRFLLMLGNTTLKGRIRFLNKIFWNKLQTQHLKNEVAVEIQNALSTLSKNKTGALILMMESDNGQFFESSGVRIDARISDSLIRNIFAKSAPLHDGALIIADQKIHSASVVLPISDSKDLSKDLGLRHRAAIGATENFNAAAFVVSEETGKISYAFEGKMEREISQKSLKEHLLKHL